MTRPPAAGSSLHSTDLDEVRHHGSLLFCPHRLELVEAGGRLDTEMRHAEIGALTAGQVRYGAAVDIDPGCLPDFYLLQWPAAGAEIITAGGRRMVATADAACLVGPHQPFSMRHERGTHKRFLRIGRPQFEQQATSMGWDDAHLSHRLTQPLQLSAPHLGWLRDLLRWLFDAQSQSVLQADVRLATAATETVVLALLRLAASPDAEARQVVVPAAIRRAERFIAEHLHQPLNVSEIAAAAGISVRGLHAGFQRARGCTPMDHVRACRLEGVRMALDQPLPQSRGVTEVALDWGFTHMGLFASAYRARFGELPSHTFKRARTDAPLP